MTVWITKQTSSAAFCLIYNQALSWYADALRINLKLGHLTFLPLCAVLSFVRASLWPNRTYRSSSQHYAWQTVLYTRACLNEQESWSCIARRLSHHIWLVWRNSSAKLGQNSRKHRHGQLSLQLNLNNAIVLQRTYFFNQKPLRVMKSEREALQMWEIKTEQSKLDMWWGKRDENKRWKV